MKTILSIIITLAVIGGAGWYAISQGYFGSAEGVRVEPDGVYVANEDGSFERVMKPCRSQEGSPWSELIPEQVDCPLGYDQGADQLIHKAKLSPDAQYMVQYNHGGGIGAGIYSISAIYVRDISGGILTKPIDGLEFYDQDIYELVGISENTLTFSTSARVIEGRKELYTDVGGRLHDYETEIKYEYSIVNGEIFIDPL